MSAGGQEGIGGMSLDSLMEIIDEGAQSDPDGAPSINNGGASSMDEDSGEDVPPQLHGRLLGGVDSSVSGQSSAASSPRNSLPGEHGMDEEYEEGERMDEGSDSEPGSPGPRRGIRWPARDTSGSGFPVMDERFSRVNNDNRKCVNNNSKSCFIVEKESYSCLKRLDGAPFCFLSRGQGPTVPIMAMQQIMCLQHVLASPVGRAHIIDTDHLKVAWKSQPKQNNWTRTMDKLLTVQRLGEVEIQEHNDLVSRIMPRRIDEYPNAFYCNFPDQAERVSRRVVPFADILLAPVPVTFKRPGEEKRACEMFWIVTLRTSRAYNFVSHLRHFLRPPERPKDYQQQQEFQEIYKLWHEVLLFQYSMSPSASSFIDEEGISHVNPIDRLEETEGPDGMIHCCNIFEVYRGILKAVGSDVEDVAVAGFDDTVMYTNQQGTNFPESIGAQKSWQQDFQAELMVQQEKQKPKAPKGRNQEDPEAEEIHEEEDLGACASLPPPCSWPAFDTDDTTSDPRVIPGLPVFPVCMMIDAQGGFGRERSVQDFRQAFGDLPAKATMVLTQMMYSDGEEGYSMDRFLPPAKLLSPYDRFKAFGGGLDGMDGFVMAGHYTEHSLRNMKFLREQIADVPERVSNYSSYLRNALRFHAAMVGHGHLRNKHAEASIRYIGTAAGTVNTGMLEVRRAVFGSCFDDPTTEPVHTHQWVHNTDRWTHWRMQCPDSFVFYGWEFDEMHRDFNATYSNLTPCNLKTCMEVIHSCTMYRLGQGNPNWTRMGMLCAVMDGMGKLPCKMEGTGKKGQDTRKKTGAGLDYIKWSIDIQRQTYQVFLGLHDSNDKQKLQVVRRATEGAYYDYVVMMGKQVIKAPEDVGADTVMNEGPGNSFQNVNGLFNQIDRDEDPDASILSTVDPQNNNNRKQTTAQPIKGFKLFLVMMGKNNLLESKAEERYSQMMIPSFPCPSNYPNDEELYRGGSSNGGNADPEHRHLHAGAINQLPRPSGRMRGATPNEVTQKLWAPFLYFLPAIAGSCVALSNKLGSWRLPINYAVKSVVDILFTSFTEHFKCLMEKDDARNAARYLENMKCRMVAHTVMKKVHQALMNSKTPEEAQLIAVQSLCVNGMHMSLVAPLFDMLVQRLVKYAPILCLSVTIPYAGVPILSLRSVLELLNGCQVSDDRDRASLKDFLLQALEKKRFIPASENSTGECDNDNITAYITTGPTTAGNSESSDLRYTFPNAPDKDPLYMAMCRIGSKIYKKSADTLSQCAQVESEGVFAAMFNSTRECEYDLRRFFGGMSCMHDSRRLFQVATGVDVRGMTASFADQQCNRVDPMFVTRRTCTERFEFAMGIRVWDALLFASLIQRPRRDFGIISDFSKSVVTYMLQMLPTSVFPYQSVPATRCDNFSERQVIYHIGNVNGRRARPGNDDQQPQTLSDSRPENLLRFEDNRTMGPGATFAFKGEGPTGVVEDESFMAPIMALASELSVRNVFEIPLYKWDFDIAWEWGVVYPMRTYIVPEEGEFTNLQFSGQLALVLNHRRFSMQLYSMTNSSWAELDGLSPSQINETNYQAHMTMLAEFTPSSVQSPVAHKSPSFFGCQKQLFSTGVGPLPYIRRPGVGVILNAEGGAGDGYRGVGCIVPHRRGVNGCKASRGLRCYFCVGNPFYEVVTGEDTSRTFRVLPHDAMKIGTIMKPGVPLLLDAKCPALLACFAPHSLGARPIKKRPRDSCQGAPVAGQNDSDSEDIMLDYVDLAAERRADPPCVQGGVDDFLLCWLQVQSKLVPRDGLLAIGVNCRFGEDSSKCFVLHVDPSHLRQTVDEEVMAGARQFVYGPPIAH